MKIKISKTVTEEIEVDVPNYFIHEGYSYMFRDGKFTRVWNSEDSEYSCIITNKTMASNIKSIDELKPITKKEFYTEFTTAIQRMTGFKYEPESEAELNNWQQADDMEADVDNGKYQERMVKENAFEREQFSC